MTTSAKVFLGITIALAALMSAIAVAGVIVLSSLGLYYFVSAREANELLVEGSHALAGGEYDAAIAQYSLALRKPLSDQQKAFVYINRGYAYNAKRQFAAAIADHSAAIRLDHQLSYAFSARGYAYLEMGELEKAFDDLTESIRLDPNSDFAYFNRGMLLVRKGDLANALMDFNEAVRCNPERADWLMTRGLCYVAINDLDRALANFDGAIATDPTNAIGYFGRSYLYARRGNSDKQQRDSQQALRLNPNAEKLWMEFDQWFTDQAKIDVERKKHFDFDNLGLLSPSYQSLSPQQVLSRNAGKTYRQLFEEANLVHAQGNYEDEIALWNEVVAMNISAVQAAPAIMNRGSAYSAKGDLDRALRDYDQAIELNPRNAGAYVNRALALAKKGEFESAMNDYAEAISLNPQQWEAYFNRAAEFRDRGKLCEAVDDLETVMELNPGFVGAYMNRADIYVRQGELDKAIDDYNAALLRDANLGDLYLARGNIFLKKKDYRHALPDFQTAVQTKIKRPERALNALAWLRATCPEAEIRNGKEAVKLALKACELSQWKEPATIDTLAAAYAEQGDFDRAIKYQKQALQIGKSSNVFDKIKEHLALYEKHKPYRDVAK